MMKISPIQFHPWTLGISLADVSLDTPVWVVVAIAIIGSVGMALYQIKQGDPATKTVARVLLGFGCGVSFGPFMALKIGVDKMAGVFGASVCSPAIIKWIETRINKTP